jgi:hypothetical protein
MTLNELRNMLIDASNAVDDVDDELTDAQREGVQTSIDQTLGLLNRIDADNTRQLSPEDEAYERAAARYDGEGKDWR